MRSRLPILLVLVLLVACGGGQSVENGATTTEPVLALDLPLGDDDSVLVGSLQDATRFPDGRLALLDSDQRAVVIVSAEGAVLSSLGRQGEGPGEFTFPVYLGRCAADSLFVWDMAQSRVSIFSPDGNFARQMTAPTPTAFQPDCLPSGNFAVLDATGAIAPPTGGDPDTQAMRGSLLIVSPDGDSLAAAPGQPLGQPSAIGSLAGLAVAGDRIILGLSSSPIIRTYGQDGVLLAEDSVPLAAVPLEESRYLAIVDRLVAQFGDPAVRSQMRDMIIEEGRPEFAPHFTTMHGSPDGTLWWVTSLPVDSSTTLMGFRDGRPELRLEFPAGMDVYEVGNDYLLGKLTDEIGFEHLVLYSW